MPRRVHEKIILRHIEAEKHVAISILIGNAQHGEWWIWIDSTLLKSGTDTETEIPIGNAAACYGRLVQVEVRCDDTNAQSDRLSATIALVADVPLIEWKTDNEGHESPHGFMTSIADVFVMPVTA